MARSILAALVPILFGGCSCWDDQGPGDLPAGADITSVPSPVGPVLDVVRVIPPQVFAEAGRPFQVEVQARDVHGTVVAVSPASGMEITWTGGSFDPADASPTVFVAPAGVDQVEIGAVVRSGPGLSLTYTAEPAVIHVTDPAKTLSLDRFRVEHTPQDPPVALLLDVALKTSANLAMNGSDVCRKDLPVAVVGQVYFSQSMTECVDPTDSLTFPEASVFSPRKQAWFESRTSILVKASHDGLEQPWSDSPDLVRIVDPGLTNLPVPPDGAHVKVRERPDTVRVIPVYVRYDWTATGADLTQWNSAEGMRPVGEELLADVSTVFEANRLGIRLEAAGHDQSRLTGNGTPSSGQFTYATGCQLQAGANPAWAETEFDVDLDVQRLNLVFVDDIAELGTVGVACLQRGRSGRLIVMEWTSMDSAWLTHEIGHVLANETPFLPQLGHTSLYNQFDHTNVMSVSRKLGTSTNQSRVSLGQAFRINFHPASWVTQVAPGTTQTRPCPNQQADPFRKGDCPVLDADLIPGPPP